ncbi:MAG: phytanoyl-CoA dioxygenase family protein, partial [Candidatus Poribacteria bacterium]|nr:phytanoyl-CoA dioxygenase family protein [Candidatus Poribacteria bacterium]
PLEARAVAIEAARGDAILFSNLLFHRGLPNRSDRIRWSADFRYQDATQSTMRKEMGFLLRSRLNPTDEIHNATQWASARFG